MEEEAAETLNNFFQPVFLQGEQGEVPEFPEQVEPNKALYTIDITPSGVQDQLLTLDETKAAGPDGISTILLKRCAHALAHPLSILFSVTYWG